MNVYIIFKSIFLILTNFISQIKKELSSMHGCVILPFWNPTPKIQDGRQLNMQIR